MGHRALISWVVIGAGLMGAVRAAVAQPSPAPAAAPAPAPDSAPTAPAAPDSAPAPSSPAPDESAPDTVATEPDPSAPDAAARLRRLDIHGFVSEGAFISTANDYIGKSSRGSLEMFEAGINVSTEIADRLRAGIQLFGRDVGTYEDLPPRLDWAFLDYHWKSWLGLRAGVIKLPLGLYNEYADIDAARTPILLPQSVYQLRNRSALLAHTGFAVYGERELGGAGSLEYQALLGTLNVPQNALVLSGGRLDSIDTKYMTGGQVFWHPPVDGLRVGGTYLRTSIDFNVSLDSTTVGALMMAGLVPPTFDGKVTISQRPDQFLVGSAEYTHEDWLFAAEYARSFKHQRSTLKSVLPTFDEDNERFYAMVSRRFCRCAEASVYYSVFNIDANDRGGTDATKFPKHWYAFQRDLTATIRYDVNERWLWKLEGHFIDGVADLYGSTPDPKRYWGLFLVKTSVTF
jgi:hypothetical protein